MEGSGGTESYLTVADVAEMLQLNQQTVRNWIDQGSLPALRVGRRVRIRRSDLEQVLAAGSTIGGADNGPSGADFWSGTPVGIPQIVTDRHPATGEELDGAAQTAPPAPAVGVAGATLPATLPAPVHVVGGASADPPAPEHAGAAPVADGEYPSA